MKNLRGEIEATQVPERNVAIWWLGQAGFVFKSHGGTVLYLDAYLSDVVERQFQFKRLSLAPIDIENVRADWFISSHEHLDHLDTDALPIVARNNPSCRFAGSASCMPEYEQAGIATSRQLLMMPNETYTLGDVTVYTAKADHGELTPSALSLLFDFNGARVLFTGDTCLHVEWMQPLIDLKPDLLIPCINGKFGNMNSEEAAELTRIINPPAVIPCHFWMFKEANGDPESFVQACAKRCPEVKERLLTPGERMLTKQEA